MLEIVLNKKYVRNRTRFIRQHHLSKLQTSTYTKSLYVFQGHKYSQDHTLVHGLPKRACDHTYKTC